MTDRDSTLRGFGPLLQVLEDGQVLDDMGAKLNELAGKLSRQAEAVGKAKGELTLKLKLSADNGGTVQIDAEIGMREPKPPRSRTVVWLDKNNALHRENPKQQKLALREVAPPKAAKGPAVVVDADGVVQS